MRATGDSEENLSRVHLSQTRGKPRIPSSFGAIALAPYTVRTTINFQERRTPVRYRAAADATPSGDSLRFAILAALNIADELFRCREITRSRDGVLAERAGELERLLDRVLMAS